MTPSVATFLDAMILVGAFLLKLIVFQVSLNILEKGSRPPSILRSGFVNVVIALIMAEGVPQLIVRLPTTLLEYHIFLTAAALFVVAILLSRVLCDIRWVSALAAGVVLGVMTLTLDHFLPILTARFIPEGSSFAEFRNRSDAALAKARAAADQKAASQVKKANKTAGVLRKGLDALATLTTKSEQEALRDDLSRGFEMYAERKRLMDEMTPEERVEYQAQMAEFMQEHNLDPKQYSMDKVGKVSTNDISTIVTALKDLQDMKAGETGPSDTTGMRTISQSLATISSNMTSISLSEKDMALLKDFETLFGSNQVEQAVALAKSDFEQSGGSNAVSFALLAAVSQMKKAPSNAPPLLVGALNASSNVAIAGSASAASAAVKRVERRAAPPPKPVDPRRVITRVPYTTGDLLVPGSVSNRGPWIKAASALRIKGYMKFHDKTAALLVDGGVLMPGDEWTPDEGNSRCTFTIESIQEGCVNLRVPAK